MLNLLLIERSLLKIYKIAFNCPVSEQIVHSVRHFTKQPISKPDKRLGVIKRTNNPPVKLRRLDVSPRQRNLHKLTAVLRINEKKVYLNLKKIVIISLKILTRKIEKIKRIPI